MEHREGHRRTRGARGRERKGRMSEEQKKREAGKGTKGRMGTHNRGGRRMRYTEGTGAQGR